MPKAITSTIGTHTVYVTTALRNPTFRMRTLNTACLKSPPVWKSLCLPHWVSITAGSCTHGWWRVYRRGPSWNQTLQLVSEWGWAVSTWLVTSWAAEHHTQKQVVFIWHYRNHFVYLYNFPHLYWPWRWQPCDHRNVLGIKICMVLNGMRVLYIAMKLVPINLSRDAVIITLANSFDWSVCHHRKGQPTQQGQSIMY